VYPAHQWGWDEPEITENTYGQHVTGVYLQMFNHPSGWTGSASWPGPPSPQADAHNRAVSTFQEFGAKGA
jgi:hypothetical protein